MRVNGLAAVQATWEPSGEIRLRSVVQQVTGRRKVSPPVAIAKRAGCAQLVYSDELRENRSNRSGHGELPAVTAFGSKGRRMVKNCCGALERQYGKRIVFATITLPGSTQEAREAFAKYSAKAIELLTHWIHSIDKEADYVYVFEWQRNHSLHIHAAIGSVSIPALRRMERGFKMYVYRMFGTISRLSGCDVFARAGGSTWRSVPEVLRSNCVPVRKSVKRYMSKYLSKGGGERTGYCPSRWWGAGRTLRKRVEGFRQILRFNSTERERVDVFAAGLRQLLSKLASLEYTWSEPYSAYNKTHLYYVPDPLQIRAWELLEHEWSTLGITLETAA